MSLTRGISADVNGHVSSNGFENSARNRLRTTIDNVTHMGDAPKVTVRNGLDSIRFESRSDLSGLFVAEGDSD